MKRTHLLAFALLIIYNSSIAQLRIDKVIPPSFNSTALIKYCDHPVGIPYGIPKIKFPIRTLINDDLFIPISMNYHAIGIKVEEEASWAGLGWYLDAGGVITRIIRGENDLGIVDEKEATNAKGYPFEHIKPCFEDCNENENVEFHTKVCAGEIDSDPDIFFFNILGMKGKFFLTPDHDPNSKSISIEIISPRNMTATFNLKENSWTFKESRGFIYQFKTREITTNHNYYLDYKYESHSAKFDHIKHIATTSWYLDKVVSPNGAIASFKYDTSVDGLSTYISEGAYQKMNINDGDVWDVHYSSYCFPEDIENVQINSINIHQDIYPKSISCGEYEATFHKSEQEHMRPPENISTRTAQKQSIGYGRQQLDSIVVKQNGNIIASSKMNYSMYKASQTESLGYLHRRLKLDSLTIETKKVRKMAFEYKITKGLPSKESHARDLWGFYNGEEDPHNITPSDFYNYSQPENVLHEDGKTKHYSLENIQEGVLSKINYVGGRKTEFYYDHQEFNTVSDEISSHYTTKMKESNYSHHIKPFLFGGLRIKSIIEHYPKKDLYKDFYYKINDVEGGQLIISHYSHDHHGYGHKTSGNHTVHYDNVRIKSGVLFNGHKF
ncbi:hypothetical protein [Reichenbachiella versicolor]|uniref:hypothetical protein n=1 Tax=Reichenbachiella versicolor TaxID=1821036 RepID=UPI000D6E066F|nr:hypothetical protein [Reichenbachiella versicolor]